MYPLLIDGLQCSIKSGGAFDKTFPLKAIYSLFMEKMHQNTSISYWMDIWVYTMYNVYTDGALVEKLPFPVWSSIDEGCYVL